MLKYLMVLFILFKSALSFSQNCIDYSGYIPEINNAEKIVRICLHVIQKDDGSGNFQVTDASTLRRLFESQDNHRYIEVCPPSDPVAGINDITFTKIRFLLTNIQFHQNSEYWDFANNHSACEYNSLFSTNYDSVINVYLLQNTQSIYYGGWSFFPSFSECEMAIRLYNMFPSAIMNGTLAHELGHSLNLYHLDDGWCSSCGDQLSDTPCPDIGNWCDPLISATDNCSNNIMSSCEISQRCYFSPQQIGRMHYALENTAISKFMCSRELIQNINITSNSSYASDYIFVGSNVSKNQTDGPIVITNNSNIILNANYEIIIYDGFEIQPGSEIIFNITN